MSVPIHDDAPRDHDVPEISSIVFRDTKMLEGVATIVVRNLDTQEHIN